jgi:hypothetical protein
MPASDHELQDLRALVTGARRVSAMPSRRGSVNLVPKSS